MKKFFKFNLFSFLFGAFVFIAYALMRNTPRLVRLISCMNYKSINILSIIIFALGTISFIYICPKHLNFGKFNYLLMLSWLPYTTILQVLHDIFFPITYIGDEPSAADGLINLLMHVSYPFYILIIILTSFLISSKNTKTL